MMNSLTIFISHATQVIVNYFCQRTKTSHFTFFDFTTYIYIYMCCSTESDHPTRGWPREQSGELRHFCWKTFLQLFSVSAFFRYVGMLGSALAYKDQDHDGTCNSNIVSFAHLQPSTKVTSYWRNPTSPQEAKTKWADFFQNPIQTLWDSAICPFCSWSHMLCLHHLIF